MSSYFDIFMIPLQLLIVFFTVYYFVISFFGIFGRKRDEKIKIPENLSIFIRLLLIYKKLTNRVIFIQYHGFYLKANILYPSLNILNLKI